MKSIVPWLLLSLAVLSPVGHARAEAARAGASAVAPATLPAPGAAAVSTTADGPVAPGETRLLDGFDDATPWRVVTSNQVTGTLRLVDGVEGRALCLDYDFNGVSGHAGIQRDLPLAFDGNYRFDLQLRGESPDNDLQFKLVDASGDNVWWVNRARYVFPRQWTPVVYRQRHIGKAWGPDPERTLRSSARLEFTVYNNAGGAGSVCFDSLALTGLPVDDGSALDPTATATAGDANAAVDGQTDTAWTVAKSRVPQRLALDLGRVREFGGLTLQWGRGRHAARYAVRLSADGRSWQDARQVTGGNGGTDWIALPEAEARWIALDLEDGPAAEFALANARIEPLAFSAHPNDFVKAVAAASRRGWYPRGFTGEQPYWTILGIDGGEQQGLIGEDGAVEVAQGGFTVEPFVVVDGRTTGWADVTATQSLQDGYLPIPSVAWTHPAYALRVTAFAHGQPARSQLVSRYRLVNTSDKAHDYVLALAVRPLQVNPPSQFLNTIGGVSALRRLEVDGGTVSVDGVARVFAKQIPTSAFATTFDAGMAVTHLADSALPRTTRVEDPTSLASAAIVYRMRLEPGQVREVDVMVPLTGGPAPARRWWDADALQSAVAAEWRTTLDSVRISVPAQGQPLVDTLRTSLAHMLVSRVGPRLQPGTRSYARSWIRDGAMISEGLLRMGRADVVRDYLAWYAPYQFDDGMVPCCVDRRGSDPVPENDSHGELIFNIAEYWRYTGDLTFLERMWPHVLGAFQYMEVLRASERTEAVRAANPAFYGMMPASISHEGYSAKPMHSYWDNFWALRGYKDAVEVATALGRTDDIPRMTAARDAFSSDLQASLVAAVAQHGIDYLPGAAELGDFDPTSTTIALAPGGEQANLPQGLLNATFERYWHEFVQRRDGTREWKDYTPYEWRNVAAFVRLGWRDRAEQVVDYFFDDRVPEAWNQWAEVVSRTPRTPFFLGDLPHAWVGSDFVRSALDMLAFPREADDSLVLAAGVPTAWLEGKGVAVQGLWTHHGRLAYSLARRDGVLVLDIPVGTAMPPGGLVLPWPWPGDAPGPATVNGMPVQWSGGELRLHASPARVEILAPVAGGSPAPH